MAAPGTIVPVCREGGIRRRSHRSACKSCDAFQTLSRKHARVSIAIWIWICWRRERVPSAKVQMWGEAKTKAAARWQPQAKRRICEYPTVYENIQCSPRQASMSQPLSPWSVDNLEPKVERNWCSFVIVTRIECEKERQKLQSLLFASNKSTRIPTPAAHFANQRPSQCKEDHEMPGERSLPIMKTKTLRRSRDPSRRHLHLLGGHLLSRRPSPPRTIVSPERDSGIGLLVGVGTLLQSLEPG